MRGLPPTALETPLHSRAHSTSFALVPIRLGEGFSTRCPCRGIHSIRRPRGIPCTRRIPRLHLERQPGHGHADTAGPMALLCGKFGFLLTGWLTFITSALTAGTGEISGILDRNHQLSKLFQQTVVLNLDASIRRLIDRKSTRL